MQIKTKPHSFTINHLGDNGQRYDGVFACKKQSIMDSSRISVRKSQLNGGMYCHRDDDGNVTGKGIDEATDFLNYMIATLETVIVQKPVWWDLEDISDVELLSKVFQEVMKYENSFRGRGNGGEDRSSGSGSGSEENGSEERKASESTNGPKKVVDREVQASLDF